MPCRRDCGPDKVCNEATNRCVLRTGRIGRKLLAAAPLPRPPTAAPRPPTAAPPRRRRIVRVVRTVKGRTRAAKRATIAVAARSPHKFLSLAHGRLSRNSFVVPASTVLVFLTPAGTTMLMGPTNTGVFTQPAVLDDLLFQRHRLFSVVYVPGETVQDLDLTYGDSKDARRNAVAGLYPLPLRKSLACPRDGRPRWSGEGRIPSPLSKTTLSAALAAHMPADARAPLVVFVASCRFTTDDAVYASCAAKDARGWCASPPPSIDTTAVTRGTAQRLAYESQRRGWH